MGIVWSQMYYVADYYYTVDTSVEETLTAWQKPEWWVGIISGAVAIKEGDCLAEWHLLDKEGEVHKKLTELAVAKPTEPSPVRDAVAYGLEGPDGAYTVRTRLHIKEAPGGKTEIHRVHWEFEQWSRWLVPFAWLERIKVRFEDRIIRQRLNAMVKAK
mmetsp:Transcript_29920/g.97485  ORF Transcript_29920/g.97485 Transcript_29920/m.97485 type:complete len:158 (-) Transcript_29920:69-542(-)